MHCGNCCAKRHGVHLVCYHPSVVDEVGQELMIRLLDDRLLDYRRMFPFDNVYACAKYLLLEDKYFERQIATYALLHQEETYDTTDFLTIIHDLVITGREGFARYLYQEYCAHAAKVLSTAHNTFPTLFHGTEFFGGSLNWDSFTAQM